MPWLDHRYLVDLSVDLGNFTSSPLQMVPLKQSVAFYTDQHNSFNSGFIYSQITECSVTLRNSLKWPIDYDDQHRCVFFSISYGYGLGQSYVICSLEEDQRVLKLLKYQFQLLFTRDCALIKQGDQQVGKGGTDQAGNATKIKKSTVILVKEDYLLDDNDDEYLKQKVEEMDLKTRLRYLEAEMRKEKIDIFGE